jgi:putative sterol carrier protein
MILRMTKTPLAPITLAAFAAAVSARAKGRIRGSVRIAMPDLGTLFVDETGAVASTQPADITLTADSDVFREIVSGDLNPAKAFMTRKLKVDGNPLRALKIGEILSSDP